MIDYLFLLIICIYLFPFVCVYVFALVLFPFLGFMPFHRSGFRPLVFQRVRLPCGGGVEHDVLVFQVQPRNLILPLFRPEGDAVGI